MDALAGRLKIEVGRIMASIGQQAVRDAATLSQAIKDSPATLWKVSDVTRHSKSFFGGTTQEPTERTLTFTVDVTAMVAAALKEHEGAFKDQVQEATFRSNYFRALCAELRTAFTPTTAKAGCPFQFSFESDLKRDEKEAKDYRIHHLKVTFVYEVL
jgi:hypothetical protein